MRWLLCVFANALTPKLCIQCKHFIHNPISPDFDTCLLFPRPDNFATLHLEKYRYCSTAREFDHLCGKNGKYFIDLEKYNGLY